MIKSILCKLCALALVRLQIGICRFINEDNAYSFCNKKYGLFSLWNDHFEKKVFNIASI